MSKPTPPTQPDQPTGYADWLRQLKQDIAYARQRAALAINAELVQLYGSIGRQILARQESQSWGTKVIDRLALDLKDALLPQYDGWIIDDDPATRRVFEAAKAGNLKAAVKWGTQLENCHPQQRIGKPTEVARLALAIAEGGMNFLQGACIGLDGGISKRLFDPTSDEIFRREYPEEMSSYGEQSWSVPYCLRQAPATD